MLCPVYKLCPLCLCGSGPNWLWGWGVGGGRREKSAEIFSTAQSLCLKFSQALSYPSCHNQVKNGKQST